MVFIRKPVQADMHTLYQGVSAQFSGSQSIPVSSDCIRLPHGLGTMFHLVLDKPVLVKEKNLLFSLQRRHRS